MKQAITSTYFRFPLYSAAVLAVKRRAPQMPFRRATAERLPIYGDDSFERCFGRWNGYSTMCYNTQKRRRARRALVAVF